jgi:hypothetical protein
VRPLPARPVVVSGVSVSIIGSYPAVKRQVLPGSASLHHRDLARDLGHQDCALERRHQEMGRPRGIDVAPQAALALPPLEGPGELDAPVGEDARELEAKALVDVGELRGEVAHGTAAHAIPFALIGEHTIEERVDLCDRVRSRVGEGRLQRPQNPGDRSMIAEVFLLGSGSTSSPCHSALPEDVVDEVQW